MLSLSHDQGAASAYSPIGKPTVGNRPIPGCPEHHTRDVRSYWQVVIYDNDDDNGDINEHHQQFCRHQRSKLRLDGELPKAIDCYRLKYQASATLDLISLKNKISSSRRKDQQSRCRFPTWWSEDHRWCRLDLSHSRFFIFQDIHIHYYPHSTFPHDIPRTQCQWEPPWRLIVWALCRVATTQATAGEEKEEDDAKDKKGIVDVFSPENSNYLRVSALFGNRSANKLIKLKLVTLTITQALEREHNLRNKPISTFLSLLPWKCSQLTHWTS